jgi:hypothetical protein
MSKSEHRIQDEIRLALSQYGIVLRLNSGKAYGGERVWDSKRNQYILINLRPVALCPKGTADVLFIGDNGKVAFIECKDNKGRPTEQQEAFIKVMKKYGHRAGVARSVEDALEIIGVDISGG